MRCQSCQVLTINGLRCHETGCPDAWRDYRRDCVWCGIEFVPEHRYQRYCDDSCGAAFMELFIESEGELIDG